MNLMIVPGILVCSSFLISVCIYGVESFAHIEYYSDYSCRVSHLAEVELSQTAVQIVLNPHLLGA